MCDFWGDFWGGVLTGLVIFWLFDDTIISFVARMRRAWKGEPDLPDEPPDHR